MGNAIFIRSEFQCLAPGGYVGRQVRRSICISFWFACK